MNSISSSPSIALNSTICGIVASPTPTVPIASLSTSSIEIPGSAPMILPVAAAAIHPECRRRR
jgi:hypothetical protein